MVQTQTWLLALEVLAGHVVRRRMNKVKSSTISMQSKIILISVQSKIFVIGMQSKIILSHQHYQNAKLTTTVPGRSAGRAEQRRGRQENVFIRRQTNNQVIVAMMMLITTVVMKRQATR